MSPEPPDRPRPRRCSLATSTTITNTINTNSDHLSEDVKPIINNSTSSSSSSSSSSYTAQSRRPPSLQRPTSSHLAKQSPSHRQRPIQPQPSSSSSQPHAQPQSSTCKRPRQTQSPHIPPSSSSSSSITTASSSSPQKTMLTATRPQPFSSSAYDVYNGAGTASSAAPSWGIGTATISPSRLTFPASDSFNNVPSLSSHSNGRDLKRPLKSDDQGNSTSPPSESNEDEHSPKSHKDKRSKRKGAKACVYCRRSHMVCEGGRPCERCIKRDIAHLCRDVTPPAHHPKKTSKKPTPPVDTKPSIDDITYPDISNTNATQNQLEPPSQASSHSQPNPQPQSPSFLGSTTASWPLLPDSSLGSANFGSNPHLGSTSMSRTSSNNGAWSTWGVASSGELGALSEFIKSLEGLDFPVGLLDGLTQVDNTPQVMVNQPSQSSFPGDSISSYDSFGNGNSVPEVPPKIAPIDKTKLSDVSPIDQYLLAAADQPDGSRASRLTQVLRAKHEAGLLKPYDYIRGYERMNRWMDSGRASPKRDDVGEPLRGKGKVATAFAPPSGSSISPESRRRILAALAGFRPKFRQIARTLTDVDLVFVEEAIERLMLQYDRALASIHTPSCIWRRTGEIQKANQEFAKLTGIPALMFRNGQLCVYELMDEDSAVRYWESYGKVAFDKGQSHIYTHCTLKIPLSLTRGSHSRRSTPSTNAAQPMMSIGGIPDFTLPQSISGITNNNYPNQNSIDSSAVIGGDQFLGVGMEQYSVIRTCFSITIRRDKYNIPVAIMGQWIPF